MSSLSNANKNRHAKNVRAFLENSGTRIFSNKNSRVPVETGIPKRYMPVKRVGSTRTADGAAFVLEDPTKVGKLVFYGDSGEKRRILREYDVGKRMGELGVGPRVYGFYVVKSLTTRVSSNNLLAGGRIPGNMGIYIIMQNLANGASKLESLDEYVKEGNPYPLKQIKIIGARMRRAGVLHGDLHARNILVKTFAASGKVRVYFIDYGRSIMVPPDVRNTESYMRNVLKYSPMEKYPGYFASPIMGTPIGNNTSILIRNALMLKYPAYIQRKRREGQAKTVARSVKRHSPLY